MKIQSHLCEDLPVWSAPQCIQVLGFLERSHYSGHQTLQCKAEAGIEKVQYITAFPLPLPFGGNLLESKVKSIYYI